MFGNKLLVGAGTVLNEVTARIATLSGAKFIIDPNFSKEVALVIAYYNQED